MASTEYSHLDRLLHRLAFASKSAQTMLAELEDRLYRAQLEPIVADNAVLVASLPRAGTTLLLETLEASPEFCCHTYRDMPFLLAPLLWSKLSRSFHQDSTPQERAHGDGMLVHVDSPEAFEEAIWLTFWQQQYGSDSITPWDVRLRHQAFEHFFAQHIKKIILLRGGGEQGYARYLSKNNLNIARLGYLAKVMPKASLVVPFRNPLQHAASLLKQHLNFLTIHQDDPFAKTYMRDIGHFDFGANLKPIDFNRWRDRYPDLQPTQLEFWLRYWVETYSHIQTNLTPSISLFSYDLFCTAPRDSLLALAERIAVKDKAGFVQRSDRASPPKAHTIAVGELPPALLEQAESLYQELRNLSVNATAAPVRAEL